MGKQNHTNVLHGSPELRDRLPQGAIADLSKKYEKSWTWIYNVVSGKVKGNGDILQDAQRMADLNDEFKTKMQAI